MARMVLMSSILASYCSAASSVRMAWARCTICFTD
jgi:hypothetical protein